MVALVALIGAFLPLLAEAQHTGGSFGGSSWGSGRRPSSSSSSSSWSRPSSSSSSSWSRPSSGSYGSGGSGYGTYSGGGGGGGAGTLCCVIGLFVVVIFVGVALSKRSGGASGGMNYSPPPGGYGGGYGGGYMPSDDDTFSLGAMAIAFDASVRARVQAELDQVAQTMQMQNSPDALGNAARTMAQLMGKYLDAAYLVHHSVQEGVTQQAAQQGFQYAVDQERGRYLVETVRADAGGVRKINAPKSHGTAEEGGGFVVVTILVARRGRLTGFRPATDRASLHHDLQVILAGPGALQAMEVVWVPSDPNDVMSSAEMAVKFPTLKPIAPDARVGRRACAHCKSVYAAELGVCPNCGAPAT